MLSIKNVQEKNVNFELSLTNSFGGFLGYIKLLIQLWNQIHSTNFFSTFDKVKLSLVLILKSPWYLFLKPWGCLFTTHTKYDGSVKAVFYNEQLARHSFSNTKKTFHITFLKIPFFFYNTSSLSPKDEEILLEKFIQKK